MNQSRKPNAPVGAEAKGNTKPRSGTGSVAQRSFVIRWRDEIRDCECLNSSQKLVAYTVASHMGASGAGWPATPTIATEASLGQRTTEGALLRLERFGFLTIKRSPGCVNRYQAAIPTPAVVARVAEEIGIKATPADNDRTPATVAETPAVAAGEIVKQVVTTNRTTTSRDVFESSSSEDPQSETDFDLAPDLRDSLGVRTERYQHLKVVYGDSWSEFSWPELSAPGLIYAFRQRGAEVFTKGVYSSPMRASGVIAA